VWGRLGTPISGLATGFNTSRHLGLPRLAGESACPTIPEAQARWDRRFRLSPRRRGRARPARTLEQNVPTAQELAQRKLLLARALRISARKPPSPGPFPSSEEMQRVVRDR